MAGCSSLLGISSLDRLTRTGIADTLSTLDELRAHGVDLVSVADGFDLNGPQAEVIIAVMAWAAKMEQLATSERIAAARERIEGRGRALGAPAADGAQRRRARRRVACAGSLGSSDRGCPQGPALDDRAIAYAMCNVSSSRRVAVRTWDPVSGGGMGCPRAGGGRRSLRGNRDGARAGACPPRVLCSFAW